MPLWSFHPGLSLWYDSGGLTGERRCSYVLGEWRKFLLVWFDVLLWFLLQSFGLLELAFLED